MMWTRRNWLVAATMPPIATAWGACATQPGEPSDHIIEAATGQLLTPDDVLQKMSMAHLVLLGELHDNPRHHARRAALLAGLGAPASVVAEHLPRGAAPRLAPGATGDSLVQALQASGFDAQGWGWPLHENLFAAIAQAAIPLHGGNLQREAARRLAREGQAALPAELMPWVEAAPLTGEARAALEQDLVLGHCGHLSASRTPGMVAAQRGRDAAMAQAMQVEWQRLQAVPGHGPVILLAGNGHVRRDYGVPTLLAQRLPHARVLTVGFLEPSPAGPLSHSLYDIAWTTPAAAREDPCRAFPAPQGASSPPP